METENSGKYNTTHLISNTEKIIFYVINGQSSATLCPKQIVENSFNNAYKRPFKIVIKSGTPFILHGVSLILEVTKHQLLYEFGTFLIFFNCQTVVRDGSVVLHIFYLNILMLNT